jgi:hypothetical protein
VRYAEVHLAELVAKRLVDESRGTDWERAHQESFLYHLLGVRDGLLQEVNITHACGLPSRSELKAALWKAAGRDSEALRALSHLDGLRSSWLSIARRQRNHFTHQDELPRHFHKGGSQDGMVYIADPLANQISKKDPDLLAEYERSIIMASQTDCTVLFTEWCAKARRLIENLRAKMPGGGDA